MFESLIGFLFQEYGIVGVGALLGALSLFKWGDAIFGKLATWRARRGRVFRPKDILLSKFAYWMTFKIDNINISDKGRREIFRDLLKIRFRTLKESLFDIENIAKFDSLTGSQLYNHVMYSLDEAFRRYEREAEESGIPAVVVNKFSGWHAGSVDFALKSAEMISNSNVYKNNGERIQAIYSIMTAMLEVTIAEAERTLTDLNGELTGIQYKGVICG